MKIDNEKLVKNYNFCHKCGGRLKKGEEENLLICASCNFHFYLNPKPTNTAILTNDKGEILLVKRAVAPKKGYWDLPGGFINLNETVEESLSRELEEELGIKIKKFSYLGSFYDVYPYQGINYPTLASVFTASISDERIKPKGDVTEAKFFSSNKLPYKKLAFESLRDALKTFLKR